MGLLFKIFNLVKQGDIIGITEFYSKYRDSLEVDAEGSLSKVSSFEKD